MIFNYHDSGHERSLVKTVEKTHSAGELSRKGERVLKHIQVVIFFSVVLLGSFPVGAEFVNEPIRMEHWPPYYHPHEAVVQAGVPIEWINATGSPHSVQHDDCGTGKPCLFDSGKIAPGKTYMLPGLPPGRYPYHCQLHPIMGGILIVEDPKDRDSPSR